MSRGLHDVGIMGIGPQWHEELIAAGYGARTRVREMGLQISTAYIYHLPFVHFQILNMHRRWIQEQPLP